MRKLRIREEQSLPKALPLAPGSTGLRTQIVGLLCIRFSSPWYSGFKAGGSGPTSHYPPGSQSSGPDSSIQIPFSGFLVPGIFSPRSSILPALGTETPRQAHFYWCPSDARGISCLSPGIPGALFLSMRPRFQQQLLPRAPRQLPPAIPLPACQSPLAEERGTVTVEPGPACLGPELYKGHTPGSLVIQPEVVG